MPMFGLTATETQERKWVKHNAHYARENDSQNYAYDN
jgi:hypothetical protein